MTPVKVQAAFGIIVLAGKAQVEGDRRAVLVTALVTILIAADGGSVRVQGLVVGLPVNLLVYSAEQLRCSQVIVVGKAKRFALAQILVINASSATPIIARLSQCILL